MTISPPSTVTISPAKHHGSPAIPDLKQKLLHLQNTLTITREPASNLVDMLNSLPTTATLERAKIVSALQCLRRKYDTVLENYLRRWRPAADPSTTPLVNAIDQQFKTHPLVEFTRFMNLQRHAPVPFPRLLNLQRNVFLALLLPWFVHLQWQTLQLRQMLNQRTDLKLTRYALKRWTTKAP